MPILSPVACTMLELLESRVPRALAAKFSVPKPMGDEKASLLNQLMVAIAMSFLPAYAI